MNINNLSEVIQFNNSFKTAVNLYLSLNKSEKVLNYIPTKSSVSFLDGYMQSVIKNKEQATLLVGPYGKGKSHLLLVLLAILSMERNDENTRVIEQIKEKLIGVDEIGRQAASDVDYIWKNKRLLPVIINDTNGDLNQAFLTALNDALKRENLLELSPDTYYSIALDRIDDWKDNYPETYSQFLQELEKHDADQRNYISELKRFSKYALDIFAQIYPKVTAGSVFNPLAISEVLPLYKGVSERLAEDYGFDGIYIVFDEFSKFIEGLNGSNVGNNMKLLQDICELATDSSNAQVFITMVAHKSIKEYGKYLSSEIINAFTGIEGRIVEKYFITSSKNNYELIKHAILKDELKIKSIPPAKALFGAEALEKYYQLPVFRSNFESSDFEEIILKGCYPLNPLAAYLLLNVSEKVAQNERTLFTFISNDEPNSMARYILEHDKSKDWIIGADLIYDYFSGLFKKEVANELVHNIWLGAETALAKCQNEDERKVIKAMAIIQIVNKEDEILSNEKYLSLAVSLQEGNSVFEILVNRQIIYKRGSNGAYVFKTNAGAELRTEIKKQREIKGDSTNYGKMLEDISNSHFIIPRKYNVDHTMTRYFRHEYMEVSSFLNIRSAEAFFDKGDLADGKVITLFSFGSTYQADVKKHVAELECPKLIVVAPKAKITCEKQLKEFEILQDIRKNHLFISDNEVMKKEIPLLEEDIITVVEKEISRVYVDDDDCQVLAFNGNKVICLDVAEEEDAVNRCCERVYPKTPAINNEIINRSVIGTGQTKRTRLNIIREILASKGDVDEEFYAGTNQEATVFRSLFCVTGIVDGIVEKNLYEVIELLDKFIDSCCDEKRSFEEIISRLTHEPYGMRMGVIPIYLAFALAKRREDLVVYYAQGEEQLTAEIVVNMCEHAADYSLFLSKEDHLKEQYIKNLNELFSVNESRNLTENRIKNIVLCMQRWFRSLPQVTRNAANISHYYDESVIAGMLALKKVLQKVEYNPYEIIFVTLSNELNCNSYQETFNAIEASKKAYDSYLGWTIEITVDGIYKVFDEKRKLDMYHSLKKWYEKQSSLSKQGLHSGKITNFMSCIEKLDVYDDAEVTKKLVKAVSNVFIDNWNDGAYEEFISDLAELKKEIEGIREDRNEGKRKLSFIGKNGKVIEKYYEPVDEGTGNILRNVLEDTLDEFDDLSVNDRVGILLEMIEEVIG